MYVGETSPLKAFDGDDLEKSALDDSLMLAVYDGLIPVLAAILPP